MIAALKKRGWPCDERCSFHLHVSVDDLQEDEVGNVLGWWIKCEPVFFDCMTATRKCNRYCQTIGTSDLFEHQRLYTPNAIIEALSDTKYHSANAYHFKHKKRKTLEFRVSGNDACLDTIPAKQWTRLILHFVEIARHRPILPYMHDEPWSALQWLDPEDVFCVLGFDGDLSPGLDQVRRWFLSGLLRNCLNSGLPGIWSNNGRSVAQAGIERLVDRFPVEADRNVFSSYYVQ